MEENIFSGIKKEEIRLPLDILGEYKESFNQAFHNKLMFETNDTLESGQSEWAKLDMFNEVKEPEEKKFVTRVSIFAPELNNYRMLLLKVSYKRSKVYPCELYNALTDKSENCNDDTKFDESLKKIFLSEEFKKPVRMLLSQIG